jgi:ribosomal protein S18 acetylase RimI-like enzyme
VSSRQLVFRVHAIRRMVERRISRADIHQVLERGEIIEEYPDDTPYPSRLLLGFCDSRPIHVVVAENTDTQETIIITTYEPNPDQWDSTFRGRQAG